jgi:hypothetical protein
VYHLILHAAADGRGATVHADVDGIHVTDPVELPDTGGTQIFRVVPAAELRLTRGRHVVRICFDSPVKEGRAKLANTVCDLDWIALVPPGDDPPRATRPAGTRPATRLGQPVR